MNEVVMAGGGLDEAMYRVPGLLISRKADGRANYSAQGKAALVQLVRTSGLSMPVLARINEVNTNMLAKWVHGWSNSRTKRAVRKAADVSLVPVTLAAATGPLALTSSAPKPVAPLSCEIVLARGSVRVQLDQAGLRSVIAALSA